MHPLASRLATRKAFQQYSYQYYRLIKQRVLHCLQMHHQLHIPSLSDLIFHVLNKLPKTHPSRMRLSTTGPLSGLYSVACHLLSMLLSAMNLFPSFSLEPTWTRFFSIRSVIQNTNPTLSSTLFHISFSLGPSAFYWMSLCCLFIRF